MHGQSTWLAVSRSTAINGHAQRLDDLERFAELGISALRYPVLWEHHAVAHSGRYRLAREPMRGSNACERWVFVRFSACCIMAAGRSIPR